MIIPHCHGHRLLIEDAVLNINGISTWVVMDGMDAELIVGAQSESQSGVRRMGILAYSLTYFTPHVCIFTFTRTDGWEAFLLFFKRSRWSCFLYRIRCWVLIGLEWIGYDIEAGEGWKGTVNRKEGRVWKGGGEEGRDGLGMDWYKGYSYCDY